MFYRHLALYTITLYLALTGLLLSILMAAFSQRASLFLVIYVPGLWFLWITCAFLRRPLTSLSHLFVLWILIDANMLVVFLSNSGHAKNWSHETGAEIIVYCMMFPLIQPLTSFTYYLAPPVYSFLFGQLGSLEQFLRNEGFGDAFAVWFVASLAMMPQTLTVVGLSQLLEHVQTRKMIN